jgi:hypothetical protein
MVLPPKAENASAKKQKEKSVRMGKRFFRDGTY